MTIQLSVCTLCPELVKMWLCNTKAFFDGRASSGSWGQTCITKQKIENNGDHGGGTSLTRQLCTVPTSIARRSKVATMRTQSVHCPGVQAHRVQESRHPTSTTPRAQSRRTKQLRKLFRGVTLLRGIEQLRKLIRGGRGGRSRPRQEEDPDGLGLFLLTLFLGCFPALPSNV